MGLCVGVDVGATKSHFCVVEGQKIIAEDIIPSQDWRQFDWQQDAEFINFFIQKMQLAAPVVALVVGASGCDEQAECDAFQAALLCHFPGFVRVVNDCELIPPALGIFDGIGLVCGTGAIAVTRLLNGEMLTAGGWGWVIGDEGSASGLMREAGRIACLHLDLGGQRDEPLIELLCESFHLDSPVKIGTAIHASGTSANLGQHAPIIFVAAQQGSLLAAQVLDEGAGALVNLVERLYRRGATARHVVAGGSVITKQPQYADLVRKHFQSTFNGSCQFHICPHPPVMGACALAQYSLENFSKPVSPFEDNRFS